MCFVIPFRLAAVVGTQTEEKTRIFTKNRTIGVRLVANRRTCETAQTKNKMARHKRNRSNNHARKVHTTNRDPTLGVGFEWYLTREGEGRRRLWRYVAASNTTKGRTTQINSTSV